MMTAIYRTRVTHERRSPVHNAFSHRGYTWYIDLDAPPRLPIWLRPFAVFRAADHMLAPPAGPDTLRTRVDHFLANHGIDLRGGRVTALLDARVLGYVANPISVFWCHEADGALAHVLVEVHNTHSQRHTYLLPPSEDGPVAVPKQFYVSPFNEVDGYYLVHVPEPGPTAVIAVSWHRDNELVFSASLHGRRVPASTSQIATLQLTRPLAPLAGAIQTRLHGISLWRRGLAVVPHEDTESIGEAVRR